MANKIFLQDKFYGGIAEGSKVGYEGAFQNGIGIDYQTDPDTITALPKLIKDSSTTVTDLVKWILAYGDVNYMYGDVGKIYKRANDGAYTNVKTVSNSVGQGLEIFNDELWYANQDSIGKTTGLAGGSPTFGDDYFTTPQYESPDLNNQVTASNTYTLETSVSETSTKKYTFTATTTSFTGLALTVVAKGTGNWTFILHDASNSVVATQTIATATMSNNNIRVLFAGVMTVGQSYHVHIISTVADGTVRTTTASDFSTARLAVLQALGDFDMDQTNAIGSGVYTTLSNAYTLPTAISEVATDVQTFVPTVSTLKAISFLFNAKGAGNITVYIHDANHNLIGSATLSNANIKVNWTWVKIIFSTALEVVPGATYHMHAVSDTASAVSIFAGTANDFETSYFKTYFSVLNTDTNFHTMKVFTNLLCIGNGNKLATLDDSEVYEPEALTFPPDERVRCLETIGDYLAISTWKNYSLEDGRSRIYFWDGTSPTYNAFIDIDGVVNAMRNNGSNALFVIHGTQGNLSIYTGAITKLRRIKFVQNAVKTFVMPGAMDTLEGLLYFGNYGATSTVVDTLVYAYGRKSKDYPMSLNKAYPISTGNKNGNVTIGAILGMSASKFFASWKDTNSGTVYGVDIIDASNVQTSVYLETLRFDKGDPARQGHGVDLSARFSPIVAGQKISIQWRRNNLAAWQDAVTVGDTNAGNAVDVGVHYASFNIDTDFFEIEFKVTLETSIATAPTFRHVAMDWSVQDQFKFDKQTD
ncbi:MAG: hypothetical protein ACP5NS_05045 [Candidatus Pacearchaeota archaeon]